MNTEVMKPKITRNLIIFSLIFFCNFSFSQQVSFVPTPIDKGGKPTDLQQFYRVDDSTVLIIEILYPKSKGFLYSYHSKSQSVSCVEINYEKSKKLVKSLAYDAYKLILNIGGKYYFTSVKYEKRKKKYDVYSAYLQEFDLSSLEMIGNPIPIIKSEQTPNGGIVQWRTSNNHFAIIKTAHVTSTKGADADVFVFNSSDMSLEYNQSFSFSQEDKLNYIKEIRLQNDGKLSVLSKSTPKRTDTGDGNSTITVARISGSEVITKQVAFNGLDARVSRINGNPVISMLGLNMEESEIVVQIVSPEINEVDIIDKIEIPIADFLKNEDNSLSENSDILIMLGSTYTWVKQTNFQSGSVLLSYPLRFKPPYGSNANSVFSTLTVFLDEKGMIKWTKILPISQSILTLLDDDGNIHVFGNSYLSNYNNGIYSGVYSGSTEKATFEKRQFVPVEITLNNNGDVLSNTVINLTTESSLKIFCIDPKVRVINFGDNLAFVGVVDALKGMSFSKGGTDDNVTYGSIKIIQD